MKKNYQQIIFITALLLTSLSWSLILAENSETSRTASISATAQVINPIGIVTVSDDTPAIARHGNKDKNKLTYHRQLLRSSILYSGEPGNNLFMTIEVDGQPSKLGSDFFKIVDRLTMHDQSVGRSVYSLEQLADLLPTRGSEYLITLITTDN